VIILFLFTTRKHVYLQFFKAVFLERPISHAKMNKIWGFIEITYLTAWSNMSDLKYWTYCCTTREYTACRASVQIANVTSRPKHSRMESKYFKIQFTVSRTNMFKHNHTKHRLFRGTNKKQHQNHIPTSPMIISNVSW